MRLFSPPLCSPSTSLLFYAPKINPVTGAHWECRLNGTPYKLRCATKNGHPRSFRQRWKRSGRVLVSKGRYGTRKMDIGNLRITVKQAAVWYRCASSFSTGCRLSISIYNDLPPQSRAKITAGTVSCAAVAANNTASTEAWHCRGTGSKGKKSDCCQYVPTRCKLDLYIVQISKIVSKNGRAEIYKSARPCQKRSAVKNKSN